MQDYWIARIALFTAVMGICTLLFLGSILGERQASVAEISDSAIGSRLELRGRVDNAFKQEGVLVFHINDGTGILKAVIFSPTAEQEKLAEKNSFVKATGKVQLYRNELEIVVEGLEKWN